jgi:hypothetical protein
MCASECASGRGPQPTKAKALAIPAAQPKNRIQEFP